MKIIDLLNKIAKGKEMPKKIRIGDNPDIFYYQKDINSYKSNREYLISEWLYNSARLNKEVEIIEENKKIEKFKDYIPIGLTSAGADFSKKDVFEALLKIGDEINEIIDYLNKGDK